MKKVLVLLGLIITSFAFNSCDELFGDDENDCKEYYSYYFKSWVNAAVYQKGKPMPNIKIHYSYTKHYCDGRTPYNNEFFGITDVNGVSTHKAWVGYNLHNNHDYVVVRIECLGDVRTRTIDYTDFKNGSEDMIIPIEEVFNFN